MACQGCIYLWNGRACELRIPIFCNKNEGTAVPAFMALDGLTSSEGTPKHKPFTHNNLLESTDMWHWLRMYMDHLFDP